MTVFIRVLESPADEKSEALRVAVSRLAGRSPAPLSFESRLSREFTASGKSVRLLGTLQSCLELVTTNEPFDRAPHLVSRRTPSTRISDLLAPGGSRPRAHLAASGVRGRREAHTLLTTTTWTRSSAWSNERQSYTGFLGTENRPLSGQRVCSTSSTWDDLAPTNPRWTRHQGDAGWVHLRGQGACRLRGRRHHGRFARTDCSHDEHAFRYLVALQIGIRILRGRHPSEGRRCLLCPAPTSPRCRYCPAACGP